MNDFRKKEVILGQIDFMLETAPEEFWSMYADSVVLLFRSFINFGINSEQVKESLNTIKEMWKIKKEEKRILTEISANIDSIDLDKTEDFILKLDALNTSTYNYYDSILGEIQTTCDTKENNRVIRPRKQTSTLITDDSYSIQAKELIKQKKMI